MTEDRPMYEPPLDPGIRRFVERLREEVSPPIETYESCQGGEGHSYPEPTIRFHGQHAEGFRALAAAQTFGLPVQALKRIWTIQDGEPVGPSWEMVFWRTASEQD